VGRRDTALSPYAGMTQIRFNELSRMTLSALSGTP
jgi:hypothetical protein